MIVLAAAMSWSCTDDEPILIELPIETDLEIPAGLNALETHYFVKRIPTNAQTFLGNIPDTAITRITPATATFSGRFEDVEYSFFREVSIWAISTSDPNFTREIFYQDIIPNNHNGDLRLFGSLSDVKDIMTQDDVTLEVRLRFKGFTPANWDNIISMRFNVYGE